MNRTSSACTLGLLTLAAMSQPALAATLSFDVVVDTTPIFNTAGSLAFDFLEGSPAPNDTAVISNFSSDAALGAVTPSGDVSGNLLPGPLTLGDSQFFNEWLQGATFGNTISFVLSVGTTSSATPDEFSFFLLDDTGSAFPTSDPSGANSMFFIELTGLNALPSVFTSSFASVTVTPVSAGVPEPATGATVLAGLAILLLRRLAA